MSNKIEEHDQQSHHKQHPTAGADAPQIFEGCYDIYSGNTIVGNVTVKGDAYTGTEYWFLYKTVPNGASAAPWPAPSSTNKSVPLTFKYTGVYSDPIAQRTTLVNAGYTLTLVKAGCSVVA